MDGRLTVSVLRRGARRALVVVGVMIMAAALAVGVDGAQQEAAAQEGCGWQSPTSYVANYTVTARTTYNVRGQPRTGCTPVARMTSGQTARVVAELGDWRYLQVNATGQWGWVHRDAFTSAPTVIAVPAGGSNTSSSGGGSQSNAGNGSGGNTSGTQSCTWSSPRSYVANYTMTASSTFNLRGQPRTGCNPVGRIASGQSAKVIATSGDWRYVQVLSTGQWGWVHSGAFGIVGGTSGGSESTREPSDGADTSTVRQGGGTSTSTATQRRDPSLDPDTSTSRATGSSGSSGSGSGGGNVTCDPSDRRFFLVNGINGCPR